MWPPPVSPEPGGQIYIHFHVLLRLLVFTNYRAGATARLAQTQYKVLTEIFHCIQNILGGLLS